MACRDCKYLDVPPDRDGKRRARKGSAYSCTAPKLEVLPPGVPASALIEFWRLNHRRSVAPDEGEGCNCFEPRAK